MSLPGSARRPVLGCACLFIGVSCSLWTFSTSLWVGHSWSDRAALPSVHAMQIDLELAHPTSSGHQTFVSASGNVGANREGGALGGVKEGDGWTLSFSVDAARFVNGYSNMTRSYPLDGLCVAFSSGARYARA